MGRIAYWRNHILVTILAWVGIAPKGVVDVHEMLFVTADYLTRGDNGKGGSAFRVEHRSKNPLGRLGTWQANPGVVGRAVETAIKVADRRSFYIHMYTIYAVYTFGYVINFALWLTIAASHCINSEQRQCRQWLDTAILTVLHPIEMKRRYLGTRCLLIQIGSVTKKLLDDRVVKREDLCFTSKLCSFCSFLLRGIFGIFTVGKIVSWANEWTCLIVRIHWSARLTKGAVGINPEDFVPVDIPTTWKAMEALYDSGYSPLGSPGTAMYKIDVLKHPVIVTTAEKLGKLQLRLLFDGVYRWVIVYYPRAQMNQGSKRTLMFSIGLYLMTYLPSSPKLIRQVIFIFIKPL
ncbi:unnamed protein product [Fraxinus pennsylvanica]|uniref:Sterol methyltransferase C-terminal domain-containing protein n=1 Tax=Fraxinus pennsylvanica TaxID=56036 RepID=A0AAD2DW87_9LAMI|nr:unnamed protein product [Fraxinus pennsylvanica]